MSKFMSVATVATTTLSALAFLSASATSLAAIRTVDAASQPVLLATPVDTGAQDQSSETQAPLSDPVPSRPAAESAAPESPRSLAALVAAQSDDAALDDEANCLATAVYFESRSEPLTGQLAVARVVINRSKSGRFPSSLCGVVTQPGQFSFVRGGRLPAVERGGNQWRNAAAIARIALQDAWQSHVEGALFFHATRVAPSWNRQRLAQVGNHIFYR